MQQTDTTSISDIFKSVKKQLKLGNIVLTCKCNISSDNDKKIQVLYRPELDDPMCDICYRRYEHNQAPKTQQDNPEDYLLYCGIQGKDRFMSFENYVGDFPELKLLKRYANSTSLIDLIVSGNTGIGKKHFAVSILRRLIERGVKYTKMFYTTEENFHLNLLKAQEIDYRELERVWSKFRQYELLLIDELGFKKPSEPKIVNTTNIITDRQTDDKKTIIFTNYDLKKFEKDYGDPLHSRLLTFEYILVKNIPDYRKNLKQSIK